MPVKMTKSYISSLKSKSITFSNSYRIVSEPLTSLNSPTFRQNLFGLSNINNAINPFAAFFGKFPNTLIRNPDSSGSLRNNYESCVDSSGLSGICVRPLVCAGFGGRLAGSCGLGTVCCVSKLSKSTFKSSLLT